MRGLDYFGQELIDAFDSADLFVLPSVHEPFGTVVVEAWAAGLPVLASEVGGVKSLILHKKDGFLFEKNNSREFLDGVRWIMGYPKRKQSIARAGQQKARLKYDWKPIVDGLFEIYQEVLSENSVHQ